MSGKHSFCIYFSGLTIRFSLPTTVNLPECFAALLCKDCGKADEEYNIELLTAPLQVEGTPIFKNNDVNIYLNDKGCLRIHKALTADDGCQVACLLSKEGNNTLYYPASQWESYRRYWHCTHLLAGEQLLLRHDALLLHSSLVAVNGKAVLFSGASGAGKSTQANLWKEHLGADILNGDRTVIMKKQGAFLGGGSPWSGTSGIFRPEQAPIAGIFLLKKGEENQLRRLGKEAFLPLYGQTTVNSYNPEFVEKATALYSELLSAVPVYELTCRPDRDAVMLAYNTLFSKEGE